MLDAKEPIGLVREGRATRHELRHALGEGLDHLESLSAGTLRHSRFGEQRLEKLVVRPLELHPPSLALGKPARRRIAPGADVAPAGAPNCLGVGRGGAAGRLRAAGRAGAGEGALKDFALVTHRRLSVAPVNRAQFDRLLALVGTRLPRG